jgi:2-amino-4-hydroxy-6-hydroxymethyldihydropteridine diphosphokinase
MRELPVVYLGLGSNIGNRLANLRMALRLLAPLCRLEETSSLYETTPVGVEAQPPFYNAVCRVATGLDPRGLLHHVKNVEFQIGRRPGIHWGPRPIDVDVLLWGDVVVDEPNLAIPHPRLAERAFVLVALAELAPDLRHPVLGKTVRQLLSAVGSEGVVEIEAKGWELWNLRTIEP